MKQCLVFITFIGLLFCASPTLAKEKISYGTGAGPMDGAIIVAQEKGFMAEQGLDVKTSIFKKGKIGFDNYLAGKESFAITNIISVVLTDFDITKHRYVATASYTDNQTKVLVNKATGINNIMDLRGKKIATVKATTAHFYLCRFLELNGVACDDVNIVFMKKNQLPDAIANGEVDAICQHGMPVVKAKKMIGDNGVIYEDDTIIRKSVGLIFPAAFVANQPEVIEGMLKATLKGDAFIKNDTVKAIEIIAKKKNYPIEAMTKSVRQEIDFDLSLKQSLLLTFETVERWAIDNRLVERTTPRNYLDFVDYKPLKSVAPDKVTIIH